jgi:hypothetical protein
MVLQQAHDALKPGGLREFVRRITSGELSYIWSVPKPIHEHCLPLLQLWCEQTFDLEGYT